ncbi:glycosyltransferase family 2 protein [Aureisphaera galaxeae]|uniref:glycosyltransferase family 2 protein n=1 Tax=Aureisphaera galaxeae TaxID=1538023 RepID=UPI0023508C13|nr:glycosyltransferase family 2 protein [Aureisphaera galaxeae]MDC8006283.1 glycosyltransferase family 2 protein [Aureisphaera galaxeae]
MSSRKITIIIPTFNRSQTIERTLQSVVNQTHTDWECLVIDDGSTDHTKEVVKTWSAKDERIQCLERPNNRKKGANACRNVGIEKSSGAYLMFLDSDDTIANTCFENRLKYFSENNKADALIFSTQEKKGDTLGDIVNRDPENPTSRAYLEMFLSYEIPWQISSPIWKKEAFTKGGKFDENLMRFQDVDFHTHMLLSGCEVKRIEEADFFYHTDDAHDKFHDETFIAKAMEAVRYYLKKYDRSKLEGTLSAQERRSFLRKMFLRALRRFVHDRNRPKLYKEFTRLAWNTRIFSRKECWYLSLLRRMDKHQLQDKPGFGFYRLNKFLLSRIFPSN